MTDTSREDRFRIRPHALTGGRVRSSANVALEAIVRLSERGAVAGDGLAAERRQICFLCTEPPSIAEVSAHLKLPLGVVRVIVGDMVTKGLLDCNGSAGVRDDDSRDLRFLEGVLDALQAL